MDLADSAVSYLLSALQTDHSLKNLQGDYTQVMGYVNIRQNNYVPI